MAAFVLCLVLFLAMTGHSHAAYCICKDGTSDSILQKNIDYACGAGADCTAILQNGACFNPNTVKDHCNYAVNSYYQRKGQAPGSCDFSGTATVSANPPTAATGCNYPSSPSNTGGGPGTTPSTSPSTTNPSGTPSTTTPGGTTTPTFGLGPSGSGITNTDSSANVVPVYQNSALLFMAFTLALLFSGLI